GGKTVGGVLGEQSGFQHTAHADVATGLFSAVGTPQVHAALAQCFKVGLGGGVVPHGLVHGRGKRQAATACQAECGQQIAAFAGGPTCNKAGAGGGDQNQVGPAGEFDMAHGGFGLGVEQVGVDAVATEGPKGEG